MANLATLVRDSLTAYPLSKTLGHPMFHCCHPGVVFWGGCRSPRSGKVARVGWAVLVRTPADEAWVWGLQPGEGVLEGLTHYVQRAVLVAVWDYAGGANEPVARIMWLPYSADAPCEVPDDHACDFLFMHARVAEKQDVPLSWIVGASDLVKGDKSLLMHPISPSWKHKAHVSHEIAYGVDGVTAIIKPLSGKSLELAQPALNTCTPAFHTPEEVSGAVRLPLAIGEAPDGAGG